MQLLLFSSTTETIDMSNVKVLTGKPSLFTTQLSLVVGRIRDLINRMEGYVQKPGEADVWYDLWSGHRVQLERVNIGGAAAFSWSDLDAGWTITATLTKSTELTRSDVVTRFSWVVHEEVLGYFNLADGNGTAWLQDPEKVFDRVSYSSYPPKATPTHMLDPMVVNIHSITAPNGKRIRLPESNLTANIGQRISGIFTVYSNGMLRYGHAGPSCEAPQLGGGSSRRNTGERLAVIELTVRNKADSLDGLPTGVSVRVLEQHDAYTTGPEVVLSTTSKPLIAGA